MLLASATPATLPFDEQPLAPATHVLIPNLFERTWNTTQVFLNTCDHWILDDSHSVINKQA